MMRSATLAIGTLAVLGLIWFGSSSSDRPDSGGSSGVANEHVTNELAEQRESDSVSENAQRVVIDSEAAGNDSQQGAASRWRVLVVDDATGEPVPGAEVLGFEPEFRPPQGWNSNLESIRSLQGESESFEAHMRRLGRVTRTGPDGVAHVTAPPETQRVLQLAAVHDQRYGSWHRLGPGPTEVEIRLIPSRDLHVEVVDTAGDPVTDVLIAQNRTLHSTAEQRTFAGSWLIASVTDADGHAVLEKPVVNELIDASFGLETRSAQLTAVCPGARANVVTRDGGTVPAGASRIVLPPHGTLVVTLPAGLISADDKLWISCPSSIENFAQDNLHRLFRGIEDRTPGAPGRDVFTFFPVALDREFSVRMTGSNNARIVDATVAGPTVAGPTAAGPTAAQPVATVDLEACTTVLTGRLVDATAQPVVTSYSLELTLDGVEEVQQHLPTSKRGEFRYALRRSWAGKSGLSGRFTMTNPEGGFATFDIPRTLPVGAMDVGDLVVATLPPLVQGVVVDERGERVPNPRVQLRSPEPGADPDRYHRERFPTTFRADGSFSIRGTSDEPELLLVAHAAEHVQMTEPVRVATGSRDLRITLPRAGSIVGTTTLLAGTSAFVEVTGEGQSQRRHVSWRPDIGKGASFVVDRLTPGRYGLSLRLPAEREPLLTLENLIVRPGEICDDPRLRDIDIAGVRQVRLIAVAPEGQSHEYWRADPSWTGAAFALRRDSTWFAQHWDRDPRLEADTAFFQSTRPTETVLVAFRGCRPAIAEWRGEDELKIELKPAFRVRIRVPDNLPIHTLGLAGGPEFSFRFLNGSRDVASTGWPGLAGRSPSDGVVEFEVPEPGRYRIVADGQPAFEPRTVDAVGSVTEITLRPPNR